MERETTQEQQGAKAHKKKKLLLMSMAFLFVGVEPGKLNAEGACGLASRQ